jgi:hypothetical protein
MTALSSPKTPTPGFKACPAKVGTGFALERDDLSANVNPALAIFWWSMMFSENRYPPFGIML